MNLTNFEQHIDPVILQRGLRYYNDGAVIEVEEIGKGVWQAEVEGTEVYTVEAGLSGKNKIETLFCDCPYEGSVCKHGVAVLYTIREITSIPLKKEDKKSKKLSFPELLEKVTLKELRDFIKTYAEADKRFRTQFELSFAHKDERSDIGEKYTKLIKSAIRSHSSGGFIEYRASHGLSRELDAALAKAQGHIDSNNFRDGLLIAQVVVKLAATEVIPNCDDSSGVIGGSIYAGIQVLETVAHSDACSRELKEDLFRFLNSELTNSTYFDYGDFGYNLFGIYRYVCGLLGKQSEFFVFTDRLKVPRPDSWHDGYTYAFFVQQKILFYQETWQEAEAETLARQNMAIVEVRQGFVDRLSETKTTRQPNS